MTKDQLYISISKKINSDNYATLAKHYQFNYNEMLGLLDFGIHSDSIPLVQKVYLKNLLASKRILLQLEDQKIGILSDTHIGSEQMNWEYINTAYQLFLEEGVTSVFHLGDLFDGFHLQKVPTKIKKRQELIYHGKQQIDDFVQNYPTNLDTYVLLGNHDETFDDLHIPLYDLLSTERENLHILGYGASYVACKNFVFYLEHPVKCCTLVPPKFDCDLVLRGHSHFLRYRENLNRLHIPACSDLKTCYATFDSYPDPGCAIMGIQDNSYTIEGYCFQKKNISKSLVLSKEKRG